jgi:hypothetical protein
VGLETARAAVPWHAALTIGAPPACVTQQDSSTAPMAIVNVNVLPMNAERVLRGQTVIVENSRKAAPGRPVYGQGRAAGLPATSATPIPELGTGVVQHPADDPQRDRVNVTPCHSSDRAGP